MEPRPGPLVTGVPRPPGPHGTTVPSTPASAPPAAVPRPPAPRREMPPRTVAAPTAPDRDAGWVRRYTRRLPLLDASAALVAGLVAHATTFWDGGLAGWLGHVLGDPALSVVLLPVIWVAVIASTRAYEARFLFSGPEELRRVAVAGVSTVAAVSTAAYVLGLSVERGYVVTAVPLALLLTLALRLAARHRVHVLRRSGRRTVPTLVVGRAEGVRDLVEQLALSPQQGMRVVGCCTTSSSLVDADGLVRELPVPVLGGMDDVVEVVRREGIATVAVLPCAEMDSRRLRRLGWRLEETTAELVVAPGIAEVAGPRVAIRPVAGLPLLHLERPELRGLHRVVKGGVDRVGALLAVLALAPVLAAVAVLVRTTSPGPVLYRQERVGADGRPFPMLKFRSMVDRADEELAALMAVNEGNGVLFKMRGDPRVTAVGRVLRRYSLDELPQLFNVLRGEMSLVGPRPPLASEVERYGQDMHRRFAVKPGITGLWQVSGRSHLSAEESERLDVRYVESWSPATDAMILWKTVGSVVRGRGAY